MSRQLNINMFTNQNEITKSDFETLVNSQNLEVYTQDNLRKYIDDVSSLMEKGEQGESLTSEQTNTIELAKSEISQLHKMIVVDNIAGEIVKVPFYVKPNNDLIKGKSATVGEIRKWGDKSYKKQPNGKWMEVSEHGMTKKEHEEKAKLHESKSKDPRNSSRGAQEAGKHIDKMDNHKNQASKLSDKEHDESELSGGKKDSKGNIIGSEEHVKSSIENINKYTKDDYETLRKLYSRSVEDKEINPKVLQAMKDKLNELAKEDKKEGGEEKFSRGDEVVVGKFKMNVVGYDDNGNLKVMNKQNEKFTLSKKQTEEAHKQLHPKN